MKNNKIERSEAPASNNNETPASDNAEVFAQEVGQDASDAFYIDPASVRLDESELDQPAVKPELISLPVRKPEKFEFIRVCADPNYRYGPLPYIEIKRSREYYLFTKELRPALLPREYWVGNVFLVTNTLEKPLSLGGQGPESDGGAFVTGTLPSWNARKGRWRNGYRLSLTKTPTP